MAELKYETGRVIIQEGEVGSSAYLLKSGRVEVTRRVENHPIVLAVLEKGQVFGEMSLVDERPRSATVTALETCVLEEITRETASEIILSASPLLRYILTGMVDRIRGMDEWASTNGVNFAQKPITSIVLSGASERARVALEGSEALLARFPYRIGRSTSNRGLFSLWKRNLLLEDIPPYNVSRNHFAIARCHEDVFVVDEGSTVGTIVNGTRVGGSTSVRRVRCDQEENLIIAGSAQSPYQFLLRVER